MLAALPPVSRRDRLILVAILAVGVFLRLWTIGYGVPYGVGVDEPDIMRRVVTMLQTGSFNPHFWDYGGVTFYLHMVVAGVRFLAGAQANEWTRIDQVWDGNFYYSARVVTALVSVLTIVIVYRCALRWGAKPALIAAAAMAVQPQAVRESQYALTDTPLTFLVALTMLLSLRAAEDGRIRKFFWAGLVAGLAGATKYNGILAVIMPICAALASGNGRTRWTAAAAALGGSVAGFAIGEPYAFIDLSGFLNGFAGLMQSYNKPIDVSDTLATYLTHIRNWFSWRGVPSTYYAGLMGLWITAIGVMATASQVARRSMRAATVVLLPFPLLFLWFISHQSLVFGRYALPLVPTICICYAAGVVLIQRVVARRAIPAWVSLLVSVLLLLPIGLQAATEAKNDWNRRRGHTVEQAGNWLLNNVDVKDGIVSEAEGLRLPERFRLSDPPMHRIIDHPVDQYRDEKFVYVVLSSSRFVLTEKSLPADRLRYQELLNRTDVVKQFTLPGEPTITILKFVR